MWTKVIQLKCVLMCMAALLLLTNCSTYDFSRRVVQQGNMLPATNVARLKVGMSKETVAILMGTSLLSPVFNDDRWEYAYTWRRGSGPTLVRNVTLYFKHDQLVRIERNLQQKH